MLEARLVPLFAPEFGSHERVLAHACALPLLIIHGTDDATIPHAHAVRLLAAAREALAIRKVRDNECDDGDDDGDNIAVDNDTGRGAYAQPHMLTIDGGDHCNMYTRRAFQQAVFSFIARHTIN
jgi:fermentation-respiration switch protein FrsA (DUF1100 family)